MTIFGIISSLVILLLIFVDSIFLPKQAKTALKWMSFFYLSLLLFIWFQEPFYNLARTLQVGRPVDILIYLVIIVLCREFFLNRQRYYENKKNLTELSREISLSNAKSKN